MKRYMPTFLPVAMVIRPRMFYGLEQLRVEISEGAPSFFFKYAFAKASQEA